MRKLLIMAATLVALGASPAPAAERVVMAQSNESLIWAPVYVARKLGYFADEGIDLDVAIVKSGPAALTAVTTGSAQIAMGFPATPIQAVAKGLKIKIFAEVSNQFIAELMLRKDVAQRVGIDEKSPVEARIRALKGLTIATNGTGSANDYLLRRILADVGLKPESDVTITPIGAGATILAALDQKRIDGFVATPPINAIAVSNHSAIELIDFGAGAYKPVAGIIYIGLAAEERWLKENPQIAARVIRAVGRALTLMRERPAEAKAAVRSFFMSTDQALFDASWDSQLASFPATPRLRDEDVRVTLDFATLMNGGTPSPGAAEIFTNEYVDLAERPK